jgi:hypothetical protein
MFLIEYYKMEGQTQGEGTYENTRTFEIVRRIYQSYTHAADALPAYRGNLEFKLSQKILNFNAAAYRPQMPECQRTVCYFVFSSLVRIYTDFFYRSVSESNTSSSGIKSLHLGCIYKHR